MLLRQHGPLGPGRIVLAFTASLLALLVLVLGYRRARQIRNSPGSTGQVVMGAPRAEVVLLGGATVVFAAAVVGALLFAIS